MHAPRDLLVVSRLRPVTHALDPADGRRILVTHEPLSGIPAAVIVGEPGEADPPAELPFVPPAAPVPGGFARSFAGRVGARTYHVTLTGDNGAMTGVVSWSPAAS